MQNGILPEILFMPSPHYNARPAGQPVSLLVIHAISLPEGVFNTRYVADLFMNCLDCTQHPDFVSLRDLTVSSHFYIQRSGAPIQFVSMENRAWHAGASVFEGVANCNDYSIGIELEGTDRGLFTWRQYKTLIHLTQKILDQYDLITRQRIVGHSDIAPGRKTDPGIGFNWDYFLSGVFDATMIA
jgi:AmpD protein